MGWAKTDEAINCNLKTIEEATAYDIVEKRPVGSLKINKSKDNYRIIVYNFITGSWKVGISKLEKNLSEVKNKAELIFRELIKQS